MTNHVVGFLSPVIVYGIVLGLHLLVPARERDGYVTDPATGRPYEYRINGLPVMLLVFGCLAFYPYFYLVGLWAVADRPPADVSGLFLVVSAVVFATGWVLARGANMQKYVFKRDPERSFLGVIEPEIISDAELRVLCSGFWGLSRHINYLGEVLMASGLTLALGYPGALLAWLYPLYYVVLLSTRQADDDRRCREKYGELWEEYEKRVPWRIVPGVF
ncbi:MAG: DUF1295 domain-containing protein [Spirochaetota bacterium]